MVTVYDSRVDIGKMSAVNGEKVQYPDSQYWTLLGCQRHKNKDWVISG